MTLLWRIEDFCAAVGGTFEGSAPSMIEGISIDSRTINPGDAFFAIRGDAMDGHDFAAKALDAGGALAVVNAEKRGRLTGQGNYLVLEDDPLDGLERLAGASRSRTRGNVIAVTGSVGKTSTKEMLRAGFSALGATHAPVGSFNNHWGVPLTLARMPETTRFGIFEIGMNHAGEIRPLTGMVRPEIAIVTNVEPVHIEFFASEKEIADAKAEIFEGLVPGGTAILNKDNKWFDHLAGKARDLGATVLSFGKSGDADVRLVRSTLEETGSVVEADVCGAPIIYKLGSPGAHQAFNSLAVLGAAHVLGQDIAKVGLALPAFRPPKGRGERFTLQHATGGPMVLIDESYNANPASMRAALELLAQASLPLPHGRRIAVLGDMLELGDLAKELHLELLPAVKESRADLAFLAGPQMKNLWEALPDGCRGAYADTAEQLQPILMKALAPGDVIVVKASLGTRLGPLVEAMKARFRPDQR